MWSSYMLPTMADLIQTKGTPLSLGLQGGGALGAFTWGVLDRLLENPEFRVSRISGTSAGAMNGAALRQGLIEGGNVGARLSLERYWRAVSKRSVWMPEMESPGLAGRMKPTAILRAVSNFISPYDHSGHAASMLADILAEAIDEDILRSNVPPLLSVAATNVETGAPAVFSGAILSMEALKASACLPDVFRAVEIDEHSYWDGGFSANPSFEPFFAPGAPRDLLLLPLLPLTRKDTPKTPAAIRQRMNELMFGAPLREDLKRLAGARKAGIWHKLTHSTTRRLSRLRLHLIEPGNRFNDLPEDAAMKTSWGFLTDLRDRGRDAADAFMEKDFGAIGRRSSCEVSRLVPE